MTTTRLDGTDGRARFDSVNGSCACAECAKRARTDANAPLNRALVAYATGDFGAVLEIAAQARLDANDSEQLAEVAMRADLNRRSRKRATAPTTRKDGDDTEAAALAAMHARIGKGKRTRQ